VKEAAGRNNWGRFVEAILKCVGLLGGQPWCAALVYYVGRGMLGLRWPLRKTGSCDLLLEQARALGILHDTPQRGDVFLRMKSKHDAVHTGFVDEVDAGGWTHEARGRGFRVLHGNTNGAGSRDGDGVEEGRLGAATDPYKYHFIRWVDAIPGKES
jgi:hypothetical protein